MNPKPPDNRLAWLIVIAGVLFFLNSLGGGGGEQDHKAPIAITGLHVLIVEETEDRSSLPDDQRLVVASTLPRAYVLDKGGHFRQCDDDEDLSRGQAVWEVARSTTGPERPWLIVSNHPHGGFTGPLPGNLDATMQVLRKWGDR